MFRAMETNRNSNTPQDRRKRKLRRVSDEELIAIREAAAAGESAASIAARIGAHPRWVGGALTGRYRAHVGGPLRQPRQKRKLRRVADEELIAIREAAAAGESAASIAARIGAHPQWVSEALTGKHRADVGGPLRQPRQRVDRSSWLARAIEAGPDMVSPAALRHVHTGGRSWQDGECHGCTRQRKIRNGLCSDCESVAGDPRPLTRRERSILNGLMLGDGHISPSGTLALSRQARHGEYAEWLGAQLPGLVMSFDTRPVADKRTDREYWTIASWTRTHPELQELRDRWYPNGRKIVPVGLEDELDDLALAVWFADDGFSDQSKSGIATNCFELSDVARLAQWLHGRLDAHVGVQRRDRTVTLSAQAQSSLAAVIQPLLPPEMHYKLRRPGETRMRRRVECELCWDEAAVTLRLSAADRGDLERRAATDRRAEALLLLAGGATSSRAAGAVGADRNSVDTWRAGWHDRGMAFLDEPPAYWLRAQCDVCSETKAVRPGSSRCQLCRVLADDLHAALVALFADHVTVTVREVGDRLPGWRRLKVQRALGYAQERGWLARTGLRDNMAVQYRRGPALGSHKPSRT